MYIMKSLAEILEDDFDIGVGKEDVGRGVGRDVGRDVGRAVETSGMKWKCKLMRWQRGEW